MDIFLDGFIIYKIIHVCNVQWLPSFLFIFNYVIIAKMDQYISVYVLFIFFNCEGLEV